MVGPAPGGTGGHLAPALRGGPREGAAGAAGPGGAKVRLPTERPLLPLREEVAFPKKQARASEPPNLCDTEWN